MDLTSSLAHWREARTRFTNVLQAVTEPDLTKRLGTAPSSAGFLICHVADVELLFAKNIFKLPDVRVTAKTVIAGRDTGEHRDLKALEAYCVYAADTLERAIAATTDDAWSSLITTKEFGTKTLAEAFGRIVSHTAYHAGQLALIVKYGS